MGDYCIKDGYQHRTVNASLEHEPGDYWQSQRLLLSHHAQYAVYQEAAKLIKQHGLKTVVDVGCGLAHKLMEVISPIAQVTGIDQPATVQTAQSMHPSGRFAADNFEKPSKSLGTFDLVLCVDVIEHMLDPDPLLDYIKQRCHERSYVIISTPERDARRGPDNMKSSKPEHVREWNRLELGRYLTARGFEVIRHGVVPAFRVGRSLYMLKERWRLLRKGITIRYCQVAVCRVAKHGL